MKKFAAMLMLVCSLGVIGVLGCEEKKTPAVPSNTSSTEKPGEKMSSTPSTTPEKTPATPEKK